MDLFIEYKEYVFGTLAVLYVLLSIVANRAAYENGVSDAFTYMREPTHPGAKRVRQYVEERQHEHL